MFVSNDISVYVFEEWVVFCLFSICFVLFIFQLSLLLWLLHVKLCVFYNSSLLSRACFIFTSISTPLLSLLLSSEISCHLFESWRRDSLPLLLLLHLIFLLILLLSFLHFVLLPASPPLPPTSFFSSSFSYLLLSPGSSPWRQHGEHVWSRRARSAAAAAHACRAHLHAACYMPNAAPSLCPSPCVPASRVRADGWPIRCAATPLDVVSRRLRTHVTLVAVGW